MFEKTADPINDFVPNKVSLADTFQFNSPSRIVFR